MCIERTARGGTGMETNEIEICKMAIAGDDDAFLSIMQIHKETLLRTALVN